MTIWIPNKKYRELTLYSIATNNFTQAQNIMDPKLTQHIHTQTFTRMPTHVFFIHGAEVGFVST